MKGLGFTNGGRGKGCCWFVGTTVSWSLYMEVDYVDVKVQWRDSNEASFYVRCLCFMFATFLCSIYSQYTLQESDPISIEIS